MSNPTVSGKLVTIRGDHVDLISGDPIQIDELTANTITTNTLEADLINVDTFNGTDVYATDLAVAQTATINNVDANTGDINILTGITSTYATVNAKTVDMSLQNASEIKFPRDSAYPANPFRVISSYEMVQILNLEAASSRFNPGVAFFGLHAFRLNGMVFGFLSPVTANPSPYAVLTAGPNVVLPAGAVPAYLRPINLQTIYSMISRAGVSVDASFVFGTNGSIVITPLTGGNFTVGEQLIFPSVTFIWIGLFA